MARKSDTKQTVYLHEIGELADRIGDQIETLAARAPNSRGVIITGVIADLARRFAQEPDIQHAFFLAAASSRPLSEKTQPKPDPQPGA